MAIVPIAILLCVYYNNKYVIIIDAANELQVGRFFFSHIIIICFAIIIALVHHNILSG